MITNAVQGLESLRPGDLMFSPIGGVVPGVFPVGIGQILLAGRKDRLSWRRWWRYRHVAVVVEAARHLPPGTVRHVESGRYFAPEPGSSPYWKGLPPGSYDTYVTGVQTAPRIVEAMPRGARERDLKLEDWKPDHLFARPQYGTENRLPGLAQLSAADQALRVAAAARGYVGTPYNFLTYGALAASILGFPAPMLRKWISTRADMMCSQLADQALTDAGFHVFTDGRLPQDAVPAELLRALMAMPGTEYLIPGMPGWASSLEHWR